MQEETMKFTIAVVAALFVATGAVAQNRPSAYYGPFTDAEAQLLSAVWPEIRQAEDYEDINWPAHGLARAPGTRDVQRMMSGNWDELRRAPRFEQIEWNEYAGAQRTSRYERDNDRFEQQFPGPFTGYGPFTRDESQILAELWPAIREAARYEDINWRAHGLVRPPGDVDARRLIAEHWNEVQREERFQDIDWDRIVDDRDLRTSRERQYAGGFGARAYGTPFSREEEATMSRVWGQIRQAAEFDDINWRSAGLSGPPGSREARNLLATHWGQLREAERFEDIDWAATTGQPRRVLR
jgi:hypothetical protein